MPRSKKEIVRQTISDSLIDELRQDIRTGRIPPGSRLRQLEVAKAFGVSSTPVREAFAALEREGLLISTPHRGVVVFRPTVEDLRETYDIRIPLEALATERAVVNLSDDDLEALDDLLARLAASADRPVEYTELNQIFHERIYAAARHPKLEKLICELREASTAYLLLCQTLLSPTAQDTQAEHEAIVRACRDRDPEAAGEALRRHLHATVERVSPRLPAVEPVVRA